ncbi:hypothetical protein MSM1_18970 [Mycobacterium sp. SM1]|uniref:hypothetical protein n=1 Tax=Mycobacterium sp. SM1 TaxID=2816243 RepID=UPI001BCFBEE5|nr:hypothetical protein [Mycobacterium sp. SM1]MBS4730315.1 hypothetical protein [Mycobacterium sp. SM1]
MFAHRLLPSVEDVESGAGHEARMRQATAFFVDSIHRAYAAELRSLPPAARRRLPLISGGPFEVAAVGLRNLHIVATRDQLAGCDDETIEIGGWSPPLSWTLRFYDASVLPALHALAESTGPAVDGVRRALGVGATLYHLVVQQGAALDYHRAEHLGAGLAHSHAAAVTDFATMRRHASGREDLVDEMEVAAIAGLRQCQRLLALALAPEDTRVAELAAGEPLDPVQLRRAVVSALRARGPVTR